MESNALALSQGHEEQESRKSLVDLGVAGSRIAMIEHKMHTVDWAEESYYFVTR